MRVLIRCDIGKEHGMGHASRCKALAQALAQRGAEVVFLTSTPALYEYIKPFAIERGTHPYLTHKAGKVPDVFVVDTAQTDDMYASDYYEDKWQAMREYYRIVRIDHPHATPDTCDLLILPNIHTPHVPLLRLHTSFGPRLMAGADYVMLDQEVTALTPLPYADRMDGPIVFCAGGSDPDGVLAKMAASTVGMLPDVRKVFLHGAYDTRAYPVNARNIFHLPFHREELRTAAMVVSTMGVTVYECLRLGTPVLVVGHTDRHCAAAKELEYATDYNTCWIDMRQCTAERFCDYVTHLWHDNEDLKEMAAYSCGIDGKGVERVAERILAL